MDTYMNNISNSTIRKNDYILAQSYDIQEGIEEVHHLKGVNLIIAPSNSGKTVLLIDILSKIHQEYDKMFFFSRTMRLQPVYDFVPRYMIHDDFDEDVIAEIWDQQTDAHKQDKPLDKILIVLDDIIISEAYRKSKILQEIAVSGRHLNIVVILISQDMTSIRPIIRKNAFMVFAFQLASKKEREKLIDQFLSVESNRSGDILYRKITDQKYQAIVINVHMVGCSLDQKVKKYTADPNVKIVLKDKDKDRIIKEKMLVRPKEVTKQSRVITRKKLMRPVD